MRPAEDAPVSGAARRGAALVATVVLLALAAWCLTRGIEVRSSTGGLLTAPVPSTRVSGGWLLAAAVAGTAGILTALEAGAGPGPRRWRRSR